MLEVTYAPAPKTQEARKNYWKEAFIRKLLLASTPDEKAYYAWQVQEESK